MKFIIKNRTYYNSLGQVVTKEVFENEWEAFKQKLDEEYKKMKELFITLNNIDDDELNNNRDKIKTLTENNNAFNLRVSTLEKKIDKKDDEIEELKEENRSLKHSFEHLKDKFVNLIKLIKNRIFSKKETREKYMDFSRSLYTHGVIDDKEVFSIKDNYDYCKNNDNGKEKDNFEIEI